MQSDTFFAQQGEELDGFTDLEGGRIDASTCEGCGKTINSLTDLVGNPPCCGECGHPYGAMPDTDEPPRRKRGKKHRRIFRRMRAERSAMAELLESTQAEQEGW